MSQESGQTFVFFGIVGSGKGTQVKLLQEYLEKDAINQVYIGTGERFRDLMHSDTPTGKKVQECINAGKLVDDELTNTVVEEALREHNLSLWKEHLIFDGYPRTVTQSIFFEEKMKFYKRENIKIIYIELSKEEATRRNMLRGRHDDTPEGLAKRFEEYEQKVIPAMNYFKDKSGYTIYTINGEQSVEDVRKEIINKLGYK